LASSGTIGLLPGYGVRLQWFPTDKLKIEPWFVNEWQAYARYNGHPGQGGQVLWMPEEWVKLVATSTASSFLDWLLYDCMWFRKGRSRSEAADVITPAGI
jgi:hypothetical protein